MKCLSIVSRQGVRGDYQWAWVQKEVIARHQSFRWLVGIGWGSSWEWRREWYEHGARVLQAVNQGPPQSTLVRIQCWWELEERTRQRCPHPDQPEQKLWGRGQMLEILFNTPQTILTPSQGGGSLLWTAEGTANKAGGKSGQCTPEAKWRQFAKGGSDQSIRSCSHISDDKQGWRGRDKSLGGSRQGELELLDLSI